MLSLWILCADFECQGDSSSRGMVVVCRGRIGVVPLRDVASAWSTQKASKFGDLDIVALEKARTRCLCHSSHRLAEQEQL